MVLLKGSRRPKSNKTRSRFSPGMGPITGLHCIHVVKEVGTGASFWVREYRTSPLSVPKRQHWRPSSISVDAHPKASKIWGSLCGVLVHAQPYSNRPVHAESVSQPKADYKSDLHDVASNDCLVRLAPCNFDQAKEVSDDCDQETVFLRK
jgi:hypothetical protein